MCHFCTNVFYTETRVFYTGEPRAALQYRKRAFLENLVFYYYYYYYYYYYCLSV